MTKTHLECALCREWYDLATPATKFIKYRGYLPLEPGLYPLCESCLEDNFLEEHSFWDTDEITQEEYITIQVMEG